MTEGDVPDRMVGNIPFLLGLIRGGLKCPFAVCRDVIA